MKRLGINPKSLNMVSGIMGEDISMLFEPTDDVPGFDFKAMGDFGFIGGWHSESGEIELGVLEPTSAHTVAVAHVDLTDPLKPHVWIEDHGLDERMLATTTRVLKKVVQGFPEPQETGLWWVTPKGKLSRPLYKGEDPMLPPESGCEAVNGASYVEHDKGTPKKIKVRELRNIIGRMLNEDAGVGSYVQALDDIMDAMTGADKKIEVAHSHAPEGKAKAVLVGLHQELLNQTAEFRKYIRQLKVMK